MEVAIGGNGGTPFQREVREWQRVDPNTGALLTGRLEADRWINGPLNAYGKVVDSQNVSQPNGTQHTQRKQLEVLQARTSSGSLQVVRAQTVQTSSSRWSSGTRTTQSVDGQRFSSGLNLTNGHHLTNGHNHFSHQPSHQNNQPSHLMATPSLKLSTLMKSSTASSNGGRSSPHSTAGSMSLLQRHQHQQHDIEAAAAATQSTFFDDRYQPTTLAESRVGGIGFSEQQTQQMETFHNERETSSFSSSNHSHNSHSINNSMTQQEQQQQQQQQHLYRGRSVSTDDLATDWDPNVNDDTEPSEWRRVSKIRRSFQFPKSSSPKSSPVRPLDLPENSVSVSKIRQELENGRRLNTAMRNNHVDLAALDNILNGLTEQSEHKTDVKTIKKATFLTAESLKEIRGKLRKLSDESLYKEDFIIQQNNDLEKNDGINNADENLINGNGYVMQQHPMTLKEPQVIQQPSYKLRLKPETQHTTNSLENRTKYRDTTSAEWHLRRKSYGFEKMTPPAESMFRLESSTDSGIGRSSELANWSPTENQPRGTIITFGDKTTPPKSTLTVMNGENHNVSKPIVQRRYHAPASSETVEIKRHSIAVDESKYVRDNLRKVFDTKTSIHLNGLYHKESNSSAASMSDDTGRKQKRVEFCKTEVHFAAESGRVNIVETDGKPPPTNNFRRRRRTTGGGITNAYLEAINSGVPVIHFGDEQKAAFEQETTVDDAKSLKSNVTVSIPITNPKPDILISKSLTEEEEDQFSDEISIRGILKNKPAKPRPYHLGENNESSESLWGIRLKPVANDNFPAKERTLESDQEEEYLDSKFDTKETSSSIVKSVAERVRIVEERKAGAGYSTKINLNLSNSPYSWEPPDTTETHMEVNKPIKLRLEEPPPNIGPIQSRKTTQVEIVNNGLKSTSLIMRTMRSSSHFDEAMKRLSLNDNQTHMIDNSATRLICNMNAITKSNSTNSIFQEPSKVIRPKYSSSLDGDIVLNDESSSIRRSSSYNFNSTSSSSYFYEKMIGSDSKHMEVLKEEPHDWLSNSTSKPIAAPRVKVIGSTNTVNHQLSQLRRMYDATDHESDDSAKADEEVNLYLGGGVASVPEEKVSELSGSWSRVRAKRTNNKKLSMEEVKELPQSNVMSIELHSPTATIKKIPSATTGITPTIVNTPVPKPRTLSPIKTKRPTDNEPTAALQQHTESVRKLAQHTNKIEIGRQKEPLKVVTGGARKLREHELSYFGVNLGSHEEPNKIIIQPRTMVNNENYRKSSSTTNEAHLTKWKLSNDKPDLLRHSPGVNCSQSMNGYTDMTSNQTDDGPIYENLKKPSSYNRKKDLQRDEMILNEMTRVADQTLKAVNEEHTQKDNQRRSPQKTTKTLDTIDEKLSTDPKNQSQRSSKSKTPVDNYNRPCQRSNRPSSASSNESLSRLSTPTSSSRSRSKDIKLQSSSEYVNIKPIKKRISNTKEATKSHRSSSRDTQRTNASSSEDLSTNQPAEAIRRTKRTKPKESGSTARSDERHRTVRASSETETRHKKSSRSSDERQRTTRTTTESEDRRKISTRSSEDRHHRTIRAPESDDKNKLSTRSSDERHNHHRTIRSGTESDKLVSKPSTDPTKISRRLTKPESRTKIVSSSQTKNSSVSTDPQKIRTKSSGIVTTTSSSSKRSRDHSRK